MSSTGQEAVGGGTSQRVRHDGRTVRSVLTMICFCMRVCVGERRLQFPVAPPRQKCRKLDELGIRSTLSALGAADSLPV